MILCNLKWCIYIYIYISQFVIQSNLHPEFWASHIFYQRMDHLCEICGWVKSPYCYMLLGSCTWHLSLEKKDKKKLYNTSLPNCYYHKCKGCRKIYLWICFRGIIMEYLSCTISSKTYSLAFFFFSNDCFTLRMCICVCVCSV